MKRNLILCLLVLTLLLSGCSNGQSSKVTYIGADSAKAVAVAAAGLQLEQVSFSGIDMNTREGIDYYHVQFASDGRDYEYDVDALTGSLIAAQSADAGTENILSGSQPVISLSSSKELQGTANGEKKLLSVDEVIAIALAHAGIAAEQATFVKSGLDWDDGRETYDLEFYTADYREFDYDIDPYSGEVLSFDHDAEYYTPSSTGSNNGNGKLTAEDAKSIALAQVPGATMDSIREFEVDYDDGRLEYEGKIYYEHLEYEFEIDGYSGTIRSWEVESIYD